MKRLLIGGIAALSIGLTGAPAQAGATPYTDKDMNFVATVSQLGFVGDTDALIQDGNSVCARLDRGASTGDVEQWVAREPINTHSTNTGYYAALFVQYAAVNYCPAHATDQGSI
jgi:hypothetical protein